MDSDSASRRSQVGLAGLASLCCVGPGTAAVTGGAGASGLGVGIAQAVVIALALGVAALVLRHRTDCSACDT
ncbi:hypothetical protein OB955_25390 [Halobacteria archaeon AArc-m2/3/4]|uniref:Uncharacterized protein n=1 Tax=Natronoglomus mannanivorans TaxID=2979990 RepID=A0AAP3E566_9EURY|nr:hypothetical protein [Halobacteria archaeon AArc-xg1-1]MCU4976010.1 hypothetical protein [Halobacteria archaeon AArc-m2/3/4]